MLTSECYTRWVSKVRKEKFLAHHKILIVDDEEEIREVMVMMIETIGQFEIVEAHSGNHAIKILQNQTDIGLIFCDYRMNDGNGGDVYQWVYQNRPEIPYVLVSTAEPRDIEALKGLFEHNRLNDHIVKPFDDDMLRGSIERVFLNQDNKRKQTNLSSKVSFCQITIVDFLKYNPTCKVFIKINDDKFIKIRDEDDDGIDLLEKYREKGMNEVYILKADYETLILDRLKEIQAKNDTISSLEFTREILRNLGVQEITIAQIDEVVSQIEAEISDVPELKKFLGKFKMRRDYITDHSMLTAFLACAVAKEMTWSSTTIFKKLIFAALFKDISLENEKQAQIIDVRSKEFFEFDLDTQTLIKNHMYISAQYFDKLKSLSDDVRNMILTHHERPDGSGFPRGLDGNDVSPMEALFVLTMNVAHEIIVKDNQSQSLDVKMWLLEREKFWSTGSFKRPFVALVKMSN